jgi:asparagine synthase (glutamine-hydrolysing)
MPGIVGIIGNKSTDQCAALVRSMLLSMRHESSYLSGAHSFPEMEIHCGWVAHPNSFAAKQLFTDLERETTLIFSGECFLDRDTRDLLKQHRDASSWNGGSWLLPLYAECGEAFFARLNGLFSGLLIDRRRRKVFLFNDRYGLERIYWHEDDESFYFASEAKALLRVLPKLRKFDRQGVGEFLQFGCTLGTRTLFEGVSRLSPASLWSFDGTKVVRKTYFSSEEWESQQTIDSSASFEAEFEQTFKRILPHYFQSDGQIGISLTAGLDGRMIMACLPFVSEKPICYTFAGETADTLDVRVAARLAATSGLEHRILRVGQDFFAKFACYADRTIYLSDGCLGVLGAHELYLNEQALQLARIRLTGVFGGEILREVSFYKPLRLNRALLSPDWTCFSAFPNEGASLPKLHPVTAAILREIPERRFGVIATGRSQTIFRTPYLDNELVALAYRIPPELRSSAGPALSLIKRNSEVLGRIPTDMGQLGPSGRVRALGRRTFGKVTFKLDYFYSEGLPPLFSRFNRTLHMLKPDGRIFGRHKFLHYRSWFQRELASYIIEMLAEAGKEQSYLWDDRYLAEVAREHLAGVKNHAHEINAVSTLATLERLLFVHAKTELDTPIDSKSSPSALVKPIGSCTLC